jgi:hypothetical protein
MATNNYNALANWRMRTKIKLINYKGGKCIKCGYDKIQYPRAFNFHHRDPEIKEFGISGNGWSFERLKSESDKCDLLCCRCHMELHDELDNQKRLDRENLQRKQKVNKYCKNCNIIFCPAKENQLYCSLLCSSIDRRKVIRPSKEQLEIDIKNIPRVSIGKKYGVSDNAIKKWAKQYGLLTNGACAEMDKRLTDNGC